MTPRLSSLFAVARSVESGEGLWPALTDFLQRFQSDPSLSALEQEPDTLSPICRDEGYADAYLAAVGDHLARQQGWRSPAWTECPERILAIPRFAFSGEKGRMFLLTDSPAAFRARNIFISADALTRA